MTKRLPPIQTRQAEQAGVRRVPAVMVSKRATASLATRAASVDVEARTFEAIASTETPVRRYVDLEGLGYVQADEVLPTAGIDLSGIVGKAPLLDGHNTHSTDAVLGSIEAARTETVAGLGDVLVLTCRVSEGVKGDEVLAKLASGALNAVSVGYRVAEYDVEIRDGMVPMARAVAWTLAELSLVPVGADPNARVRSAEIETLPVVAEVVVAEIVPPVVEEVAPPAADEVTPPVVAEVVPPAAPTVEEITAIVAQAVTAALAARAAPAVTETRAAETIVPATPVLDTRAILDALQHAGRGDPRNRSIRALASNANAGELGEHCIRMGMTVEQAAATIRAAGISRTDAGANIQGRSAPGDEVEPQSRTAVIDTNAIIGRLAATTQIR